MIACNMDTLMLTFVWSSRCNATTHQYNSYDDNIK